MQEAVLEMRAFDRDVVGELEHALEGAGSDALIEHVGFVLVGFGLLFAVDGQRAFLGHDRQLGLGEARYRDADAVGVLAGPLDIVGRITGRAAFEAGYLVQQREQLVEADGGTIEGGKIKRSHGMSSKRARCGWSAEWPDRFRLRTPNKGLRKADVGAAAGLCKSRSVVAAS